MGRTLLKEVTASTTIASLAWLLFALGVVCLTDAQISWKVQRVLTPSGYQIRFVPVPVKTEKESAAVNPPVATNPQPAPVVNSKANNPSSSALNQGACGLSDMVIGPRIVGGDPVEKCGTYPWMVRLTFDGRRDRLCAGVILDATHILTAAHCTAHAQTIWAVVGEYNINKDEGTEQTFNLNASSVTTHPGYSEVGKVKDISIITLTTPIDLNRRCATPICLDAAYDITFGQPCVVAGWGTSTYYEKRGSVTLRSVSLPTYKGEDCRQLYTSAGTYYFTDPMNQLCAGLKGNGGKDACRGDSGAPLFCENPITSKWMLVGVVSYGEQCALARFPGVYSSTTAFYSWIYEQTQKS